MGLSSGCIEGDGARYWGLVCWLMGVSEEIKSPCGCMGFEGYAPTLKILAECTLTLKPFHQASYH